MNSFISMHCKQIVALTTVTAVGASYLGVIAGLACASTLFMLIFGAYHLNRRRNWVN